MPEQTAELEYIESYQRVLAASEARAEALEKAQEARDTAVIDALDGHPEAQAIARYVLSGDNLRKSKTYEGPDA
jgi:hypothetical protein